MHSLQVLKDEDVRHIHLAGDNNPWNERSIQYYRTSDIHLVYCQGALNENRYLLMTVLQPDAHEQAKNNSIMANLGFMAERFRQKF